MSTGTWPSREQAMDLLNKYTTNRNLVKHALAVEAGMQAYARRYDEDVARWGVVGLLHDFDYERYSSLEDHPFKGAEILREAGYAEELIGGVLAHAEHTGVARDTLLKKAIFAVDELTGLIVAVALVRPSKKLSDVNVDSVMKKWGEKSFAAGVDRSIVERGACELGIDLTEHIAVVLEAMQTIAGELGL